MTEGRPARENGPVNASTPETFADLGLHPELLAALTGLGYEEPTPIQREAIPLLLQGNDLIGQRAPIAYDRYQPCGLTAALRLFTPGE